MSKNLLIILCALCVAVLLPACGKSVTRVDPGTDIDLSGEWNDADSRRVSEKLAGTIVQAPWHSNHRAKVAKSPVVRVGDVVVRTDGDLVNTQIFTDELRKALINTQAVDVVTSRDEAAQTRVEIAEGAVNSAPETRKEAQQETGADYILFGSIKVQNDQEGKKQVRFYHITMTLADVQTRKQVWLDTVTIKKYVTW